MREQYIRDQRKWVKLNKLKKGDRVKCIAKADNYQSGWNAEWADEEDMGIGAEGTYLGTDGDQGVMVEQLGCFCHNHPRRGRTYNGYCYPFFVLVKLNE